MNFFKTRCRRKKINLNFFFRFQSIWKFFAAHMCVFLFFKKYMMKKNIEKLARCKNKNKKLRDLRKIYIGEYCK